jgi:hypothetical protein
MQVIGGVHMLASQVHPFPMQSHANHMDCVCHAIYVEKETQNEIKIYYFDANITCYLPKARRASGLHVFQVVNTSVSFGTCPPSPSTRRLL